MLVFTSYDRIDYRFLRVCGDFSKTVGGFFSLLFFSPFLSLSSELHSGFCSHTSARIVYAIWLICMEHAKGLRNTRDLIRMAYNENSINHLIARARAHARRSTLPLQERPARLRAQTLSAPPSPRLSFTRDRCKIGIIKRRLSSSFPLSSCRYGFIFFLPAGFEVRFAYDDCCYLCYRILRSSFVGKFLSPCFVFTPRNSITLQ